MSDHPNARQERARFLMMAALDGELRNADRGELDELLADPELRAEWERMSRVKEVTETMSYREPPEEVWENYWTSVYSRVERGIGWLLVSLGSLVLFGWWAWGWVHEVLADTSLPGFIKIAIFAVAMGGAILFVSVVREKFFVRRKDRYGEVLR